MLYFFFVHSSFFAQCSFHLVTEAVSSLVSDDKNKPIGSSTETLNMTYYASVFACLVHQMYGSLQFDTELAFPRKIVNKEIWAI